METSGDVLSTVDMVMQRRDGPRRLRELDDDDDDVKYGSYTDMSHVSAVQFSVKNKGFVDAHRQVHLHPPDSE